MKLKLSMRNSSQLKKMPATKVFLCFTFSLLLFIACSSEKKHPYSDEIKNYLNQIDGLESKQNNRILIIPLNACSSCVKTTLEDLLYLDPDSQNFTIILSGRSLDDGLIKLSDEVKSKFTCKVDMTEGLRLYRTNISGPVFVETNESYVTSVVTLEDKFLTDVLKL